MRKRQPQAESRPIADAQRRTNEAGGVTYYVTHGSVGACDLSAIRIWSPEESGAGLSGLRGSRASLICDRWEPGADRRASGCGPGLGPSGGCSRGRETKAPALSRLRLCSSAVRPPRVAGSYASDCGQESDPNAGSRWRRSTRVRAWARPEPRGQLQANSGPWSQSEPAPPGAGSSPAPSRRSLRQGKRA